MDTTSTTSTISVDFPSFTFSVPSKLRSDKNALREWIWVRHREELIRGMGIADDEDSTTSTALTSFVASDKATASSEAGSSRLDSVAPSSKRARTTLVQACARLNESNQTIVQASKRQMEHFAKMSHEIRTPLNCVVALSSVLMEDTQNFIPQQRDNLAMILNSGKLLLNVVNDVLDYTKYEEGKMTFDVVQSNMQDMLESVFRPIFIKAYTERNIILRAFYDTSVPKHFETDARRLSQVLFILLGNAVKFSDNGSMVELHCLVCPQTYDMNYCSQVCGTGQVQTPVTQMMEALAVASKVSLAAEETNNETFAEPPPEVSIPMDATVLRFVVKDYGKGIKEQDFDRIFQPFMQAADESENTYGGTGLGLPIAGSLVRGLGGKIYVDSDEGEWTAFTVDLPFKGSLPDNMKEVSQKMAQATLFFVFNDCFPGTVAHMQRTCELWGVKCQCFADCQAMDKHSEALNPNETYICFVYEDQYDDDSYKRLQAKASNSILVTFGPQRSIPTAQGHFPCPNSVLPTVMMDTLASLVVENPTDRESQLPSPIPFADLRVLVAEDNLVNRKVCGRVLERIGLQHVDMVENGQDAVTREAATDYDIVLLDMQMPVMDGLEACKRIVERHALAGTACPKIAFVTAQVSESFKLETVEAGASAFIAKPFTLSEVQGCLELLWRGD